MIFVQAAIATSGFSFWQSAQSCWLAAKTGPPAAIKTCESDEGDPDFHGNNLLRNPLSALELVRRREIRVGMRLVAFGLIGEAAIVIGILVLRIDTDRLRIVGDRVVVIPLGVPGVAAVVIGFGVSGLILIACI